MAGEDETLQVEAGQTASTVLNASASYDDDGLDDTHSSAQLYQSDLHVAAALGDVGRVAELLLEARLHLGRLGSAGWRCRLLGCTGCEGPRIWSILRH